MIFYRDTGAKTQYFHIFIVFFWVTFFNCSFFHRETGRDSNFSNDKRTHDHISVLAWTQKSIPFSAMLWGSVWDISACLFTLWTWKSSSVCSFSLQCALGLARVCCSINTKPRLIETTYDEFLEYHWNFKSFQPIIILWKVLYSSSRTIATLYEGDKVSKASFITSSAMVFAI